MNMKFFFMVILFVVFFNISAFLIAATGFFPATLYGDVVTYDLNDPDNLPSPETMLNRLITNGGDVIKIVPGVFELRWDVLMGSIVAITIALGALTRSTIPVTLGLITTMFLFIYNNSKNTLSAMTQSMDATVQYIVLMLAVGILIIIVLTIMDYAAGQHSSGG